jgi:hypothetical protein
MVQPRSWVITTMKGRLLAKLHVTGADRRVEMEGIGLPNHSLADVDCGGISMAPCVIIGERAADVLRATHGL